ncbi:cytochrome P450 [Pseudoscourfieldia marina]
MASSPAIKPRSFGPAPSKQLQWRHQLVSRSSSGRNIRGLVTRRSSANENDGEKIAATEDLEARIAAGEFSQDRGSKREALVKPVRKLLASDQGGPGRFLAYALAKASRQWRRNAAERMPEAKGDVRIALMGEDPLFVVLYKLYRAYGRVFQLSFGPKSFVVISDPKALKHVLVDNANNYTKGLLGEILDFVMGDGLIPADGELWKMRRRTVVPAVHRKYVAAMTEMFSECALRGVDKLDASIGTDFPEKGSGKSTSLDMESFFSRLTLDVIGKAVFNYEFDALSKDDAVIDAVYTLLREAEYRSITLLPYWRIPGVSKLVPRQRRCEEALTLVNGTLNTLIADCKQMVEADDEKFMEEYLSKSDPSILRFLVASGDDVTSKVLRDDLMTLLIAGHETSAAVLTWTFYLLAQNPKVAAKMRAEIDAAMPDGPSALTTDDISNKLRYTTRVIYESMRLYPQPPVLLRRSIEEDMVDGYKVRSEADVFISVWNIHRSEEHWGKDVLDFNPDRFGPLEDPHPNEVNTGYRFVAFGAGKRKCLGDMFALYENVVTLSMLQRAFDFELVNPDEPVGMETGATIHTKGGLNMRVRRRKDSSGGNGTVTSDDDLLNQMKMGKWESVSEMGAKASEDSSGASATPTAAAAPAAAANAN